MSRFLLDTNVLSEVLTKRPAESVLHRIDEHEDDGLPIGTEDVLIAATALQHDLTVATRNLQHYRRQRCRELHRAVLRPPRNRPGARAITRTPGAPWRVGPWVTQRQ